MEGLYVISYISVFLVFLLAVATLVLYHRAEDATDVLKYHKWKIKQLEMSLRDRGISARQHMSFQEKVIFDNAIFRGLCEIKEKYKCPNIIGIVFHNGGIVPAQVTTLYEKTDGKPLKGIIKNIPTNEIFESINTLLSTKFVNLDNSINFDDFTKIMYENGYLGTIMVLVSNKDVPVMAVCLQFNSKQKFTLAKRNKLIKAVNQLEPNISKLYSTNYFLNRK